MSNFNEQDYTNENRSAFEAEVKVGMKVEMGNSFDTGYDPQGGVVIGFREENNAPIVMSKDGLSELMHVCTHYFPDRLYTTHTRRYTLN